MIHLINPMTNPSGGSERRTEALYRLLSPITDVTIWSEGGASNYWRQRLPVRTIHRPTLRFPKSGILASIGIYFSVCNLLH